MRLEFGFGGANDQPKHLRFGIIEDLAQKLRSDKNTAVPWHRQRLLADTNASDSLDDEIEFLGSDMLVKSIGASRRESP